MPLNKEEKTALRIVLIFTAISFVVGLIIGGITGTLIAMVVTK